MSMGGNDVPEHAEPAQRGENPGVQAESVAKDPEVRYVLSGQPTGWAAMSKDMREIDADEIGECKDDIDTLMTFVCVYIFPMSSIPRLFLPRLVSSLL